MAGGRPDGRDAHAESIPRTRRPHRGRVVRPRPALGSGIQVASEPLADRSRAWLGVGYPLGPSAHFEYIDRWRATGAFEGLEFSVGPRSG